MANIIFKYKGKNDLNLTREFNSTHEFVANKDDVKFNDTSNPFSDYLASSSCGSWTDDKIKILSLPHKGRLFYLTNPGGGAAVYADVTVGQEIVVRDMTENKVLKFSAEGSSDGQYTGNYFTEFTFERYCATTPSNVVSTVKLNMIDIQQAVSVLSITNVRQDEIGSEVRNVLYDLTVTGSAWTGNVIAGVTKGTNCKIGTLLTTPYGSTVNNTTGDPKFVTKETVTNTSIPIGVYTDCNLQLICVEDDANLAMMCDAYLSYTKTLDYTEGVTVITFVQTEDVIPE